MRRETQRETIEMMAENETKDVIIGYAEIKQ